MCKVLVTGIGAIIGYGIINSIKKAKQNVFIVGSDIYEDAVAKNWVDTFVRAPLTYSDGYKQWLIQTIEKYKIDLILPGIEQDAIFVSQNKGIFKHLNVKVVSNDLNLVQLSMDKWRLFSFLEKNYAIINIPSSLPSSYEKIKSELGTPFLLKPRNGYAGKGIQKIHDKNEFDYFKNKDNISFMAQQIIGNDENEFTVGAFGDGEGKILALITLRRKLSSDGSTSKATVVNLPQINRHVVALASIFKPIGPTNFQFRGDSKILKLLEINPRISSSTSIRTAFGYNEAAMCIDYYLYNKIIKQPKILCGNASRYISDEITYDGSYL